MKRYLPKLPALILILGAILRIAGTGSAAIWNDEVFMINRTQIPFLNLFQNVNGGSGNLILDILLRPLMAISHSVWLLRLPSMVAGLVSLWLIWKLMRRLDFTLSQQICASSLAAFLPGLLWIAQDARSYGLLSCLFLAALWFALDRNWLGLLAICGLTIYVHNIGPVFAAAALFIALYLYPWKVRRILLVSLGSVLAWIPAIIDMLNTWIIQQPWQPHLTLPWLLSSTTTAIWPELHNTIFELATLITLALTFYLLLISRVNTHGRIIPLLACLIPYLGLIIFSLITQNNMVLYRTLMPGLFPMALWLGWELGNWRWINIVPAIAWTGMLIAGLMLWHSSARGGHLDQVANEIRSQWRTGDVLVYTTATVGTPFDYYLSDLPHTWTDIVHEPFLEVPSMHHTDLNSPTGVPGRSWVIIPKDGLISPEENIALDDLVHHQDPVYTINSPQAAQINVYLVEAP
jgi:hypothetical protein